MESSQSDGSDIFDVEKIVDQTLSPVICSLNAISFTMPY